MDSMVMMTFQRAYVITSPTIAVHCSGDGHRTAIVVPANALVTLLRKFEAGKFVEIHWHGRPPQVFAVDFNDRAQLTDDRVESLEGGHEMPETR